MALYLRKDNSMQSVIAIKWLWWTRHNHMHYFAQFVLWTIDPLLGNTSNTHATNNTGVVISVIRARTAAIQSALGTFSCARWRHTTEEVMQAGVFCRSKPRHVFSVMSRPCSVYISEPNSEASSGESQETGNTTAYSGV
jgi:hypothetical protein